MRTHKLDEPDVAKIYSLLSEVDTDFAPRLSDTFDLSLLAKRFVSYADIFVVSDATTICAMVAIYCNRPESGVAFIPIVAVSPGFRNRGFAKRLVSQAVKHAADLGFNLVKLEVYDYNKKAIALYTDLGFVTESFDAAKCAFTLTKHC